MTYQVTYTESNNPAKPAIIVQDQSLNNQTSLTFVGQNYNGYAPIVANDFLLPVPLLPLLIRSK